MISVQTIDLGYCLTIFSFQNPKRRFSEIKKLPAVNYRRQFPNQLNFIFLLHNEKIGNAFCSFAAHWLIE